ncbi:hypothetical protein SAMN05421818_1161, partial [Myroides phaeus]
MSRPKIGLHKIDLFMKETENTREKRSQRDYTL